MNAYGHARRREQGAGGVSRFECPVPQNLTRKLISSHLATAVPEPGVEIAVEIDQTLTQDATGTLVMLELEAMGVERVHTERSAQYVDHNLLQQDHRNGDDHRFLRSACHRFGVVYHGPGDGVSHPVHQQKHGNPGCTLLGSDSHTPAAGAIGMLAIGAGGLDVAQAMGGERYRLRMPEVWGVELTGSLPDWVSAKDVILELLRRHGVDGAVGCVLEYFGPGLEGLSAMDRHVIANMGTELGATSSVFPSDTAVRRFLAEHDRGDDFVELAADAGATYDRHEHIDLSTLLPLIAMPSSPGNVVPVAEVAGEEIGQAYVGSSANPGYRDFVVAARMVHDRTVHRRVSFDVNPTSRRTLERLIDEGHLSTLVRAGARIHQAGCNGCIGMGQAPATGTLSLRTVPRNFPGRSGTREDRVALVSPETATASALRGRVTDPRTLPFPCPRVRGVARVIARRPRSAPRRSAMALTQLVDDASAHPDAPLERGPGIAPLPRLRALPEDLELEVLLVLGDDVSTDEIMPAGARVLPLRSNIPEIARFCFEPFEAEYHERAERAARGGANGHAVVAGSNYGQGSSREHAALAPRSLGLRVVCARSFARIHRQNLINFGVLPLRFDDDGVHSWQSGDVIRIDRVADQLAAGDHVEVQVNETPPRRMTHDLTSREIEVICRGGVINVMRDRLGVPASARS